MRIMDFELPSDSLGEDMPVGGREVQPNMGEGGAISTSTQLRDRLASVVFILSKNRVGG